MIADSQSDDTARGCHLLFVVSTAEVTHAPYRDDNQYIAAVDAYAAVCRVAMINALHHRGVPNDLNIF